MSKRQRVVDRPTTKKSMRIYEPEWIEFGDILNSQGSSLSKFIRDAIDKGLKKHKKGNKC